MSGLPGILGRIVERTLEDVRAREHRVSRSELRERAEARAGARRALDSALRRPRPEAPVRFLCEVKMASPSRGLLREDLDPARQARAYRENGAAAVSVVTEPHFFRGSGALLAGAREGAKELPLLRKDFHVHELQLFEAAAGEADAVLLLAAVLSPSQLRDYLELCAAYRLGHLVEVDDAAQAETALRAGARVVGVNNRDLADFTVDVGRTEAVLPALRGSGVVTVAESGISERAIVLRLQAAGVDALLVGEALVVADDPGARLRALRGDPGPDAGSGSAP